MLRLTVLALCALGASAQISYTWNGCDTNFDNRDNWQGDLPVFDLSDPATVVVPPQVVYFGPTEEAEDDYTPVNSMMRATEQAYAFNTLVLPSDGEFTLGSNDVRIVFYEEEETDGVTEFIGAQTDRDECRFDCHKNWIRFKGSPSEDSAPALPPCALDTAIFESHSSYHIQAHGVLELGSILWYDQVIQSATALPDYAMSPSTSDLLRLVFENPHSACAAVGLTDSNGQCFCHTSCPDDGSTFIQQDSELRARAKEFANSPTQKAVVAPYTAAYNIAFDVAGIATAEAVDNLTLGVTCAVNSPTLDLSTAIADAVATMMKKATLAAPPSITMAGSQLLVSGEIKVPTYIVMDPVTRAILPDWRENQYIETFAKQPSTAQSDRLALIVFKAIQETAKTCLRAEQLPARAAAAATCDAAANNLCAGFEALFAAVPEEEDYALMEEVLLAYNNFVDDESSTGTFALNDTSFATENNLILTAELTAAIATLNAADWTALEGSSVEPYVRMVSTQMEWVVPNYEQRRLEYTLVFGTALPQSDVDRLFDGFNAQAYKTSLMKALDGVLPIMSLNELSLSQQRLSDVHAELLAHADSNKERRAYSGGGQAIDVVRADVVFEGIFRLADDQEEGCDAMDCFPKFGELMMEAEEDRRREDSADPLSPPPSLAVARLVGDDATSAYEVQVAECCDLDKGPDSNCIIDSLTEEVQAERAKGATQEAVDSYIQREATKKAEACGYPVDANQLNSLIDNAAAASATSSPASKGNLAVVAGAAAAGVLVVAVAVYLLVFRKKARSPRESILAPGKELSAAHRSVVSFENPTYANPEQDNTYGVLDDNDDDDGGLYDQPAVTNKHNPMYASNENLATAAQGTPAYTNGSDANVWDDDDDVADAGGYLAVDAADEEEDDFDGEEEEDDFDGEEEVAAMDDQLYEEMDTPAVEAAPEFAEEPAMLVAEEAQDDVDFEDEEEEDEPQEGGGYLDVQGEDNSDEEAPAEGYLAVDDVHHETGYVDVDQANPVEEEDDDYSEEEDNVYGDHAVGFDDDE